MFNIFRRKKPHRISEQEVDRLTAALTDSMIEDLENYDVLFHDVWPPLKVPAARILEDLKNAGYNLPDLIRSVNGIYHNRDTRPRVIEVKRRSAPSA